LSDHKKTAARQRIEAMKQAASNGKSAKSKPIGSPPAQLPARPPEPKKPKLSKAQRYDRWQANRGRLPHHATIEAAYNAEKEQWAGCLLLEDGRSFSTTHGGLWGLMKKLDDMYRVGSASKIGEQS